MPGDFGNDPAIQTVDPNKIDIIYKARFFDISKYLPCFGDSSRKYLYVLENAFEMNTPKACCCFPPNCCCLGFDSIHKFYFDRGIYDQQHCGWTTGCLKGAPSTHAGEVKHVCLFQDCCQCYNEWVGGCYWQCCYGERVRVVPFEKSCCCCSNRADCCSNCFGICGPKTGEPLILFPFVNCLEVGSGTELMEALEKARAGWKQRTGKE